MAKVILICGKICSGKSTYAERLRLENKAVILSVDEIMLGIFGQYVGEKHDEYCENVQKHLFGKSLELIEIGVNVILDWGFWQKDEREFAKEFYRSRNIECELHFIDISEGIWKQRIAKRNKAVSQGKLNAYFVDENLAKKFGAIFEIPREDEIDICEKAGQGDVMYEIRKASGDEIDEALNLALEVFMEFEAPDYKPEGAETFSNFLQSEQIVSGFKQGISPMYAAFDNGKIIGIIGMRENKTHINLVFVKKEYHRKGIATAIFRYLLDDLLKEDPTLSEITLNSSPYGLPFYLNLGFVPQSEELEEDGIRYTPMIYKISAEISKNRSIEELENSYWEHSDFDSYVVRTVQAARKKPLSELTDEEIRVLTGQKVGLKYVLPMAVAILKDDPLKEIRFFEGDLLECVLRLSPADWRENPDELRRFRAIILAKRTSFYGERAEMVSDFLKSTKAETQ